MQYLYLPTDCSHDNWSKSSKAHRGSFTCTKLSINVELCSFSVYITRRALKPYMHTRFIIFHIVPWVIPNIFTKVFCCMVHIFKRYTWRIFIACIATFREFKVLSPVICTSEIIFTGFKPSFTIWCTEGNFIKSFWSNFSCSIYNPKPNIGFTFIETVVLSEMFPTLWRHVFLHLVETMVQCEIIHIQMMNIVSHRLCAACMFLPRFTWCKESSFPGLYLWFLLFKHQFNNSSLFSLNWLLLSWMKRNTANKM